MALEIAPWIDRAEEDWQVARRLSSAEPLWGAVTFHAQQCVEKYLKTLLIARGITPPRIHDLVVLAEQAKFVWDRRALARLSTFAVAARYPGEGVGEREGRWSIEELEKLRAALRDALALEPQP